MRPPVARALAALSLAALLAGAAFPALAKSPHFEQRGGKKALGEIVSFDPATSALVVETTGGDELTVTVDPEVKVKLEHRGRYRRSGDGHGNPSRGSLDDIVGGALVLRLKTEDNAVTKIRLRPAPEAPIVPSDEGEEDEDTGDALPDGSSGEDVDDTDDTDTPDEDSSGDVEDALPPLPVPLP